MAKQIQLRKGTTAQHTTFTGASAEVTVDTDKKTVVVHDGVTPGGKPLATEAGLTAHTGNTSNPHGVTKAQVGLGNVDNTSDVNKPISTATQTALNSKANMEALSGAVYLGTWATAGRPTLGAGVRAIGYNTDLLTFEGWNGTTWGAIGGAGGGATGGGTDTVFMNNSYTITQSYTIPAGKSTVTVGNASGDIIMNTGVEITFSDTNSRWVVL